MNVGSYSYDPDLQMLIDQPRDPGLAHLAFLRWLSEHGRLEHDVVGAPGGEYATGMLDERRAA